MDTLNSKAQLLMKQGADFVADFERTLREGGMSHVHIVDVKAWHAKALTHLRHRGGIGQDVYDDLGEPGDYVSDQHLSRTRTRVQAVVNALGLSLQPATTGQVVASDGSKTFDVFISYSDRDKDEAQAIFDSLVGKHFSAFMARKSLQPGDEFGSKIREALLKSARIWVLVTPNSVKSEWVLTEWGAAWVLGLPMVPILLRCDHSSLPDRLRQLQTVDYHNYGILLDSLKTDGA